MAPLDISLDNPSADEIAALVKIANALAGVASTSGAVPTPSANFFPPDPNTALASHAYPSPNNSVTNWNGTIVGGVPYLIDKTGSVWTIAGGGVHLNGNQFGTAATGQMTIVDGVVYWLAPGTQTWLTPSGVGDGTNAVGSLPAPAATSGGVTPPPAPGTMPADPPHAAVAPGSGSIITATATDTALAAYSRAAAGDTIKLVPGKVYNETMHPLIPVVIDGGGTGPLATGGAIIDGTGLTASLSEGKGGIVPRVDNTLRGLIIRNFGLDDPGANFISGYRPSDPGGWFLVDGCYVYLNQNGLGYGGNASVLTINNSTFLNNGNGSGHEHNIYLAGGVVRAILTDVVSSVDPQFTNAAWQKVGGGYPLKSRAAVTTVTRGTYTSSDSACMDFPDGSTTPNIVTGVILNKPSGAADHKVATYGEESLKNGNAGLIYDGCTFNLNCDSPVFHGKITFKSNCIFTGNAPKMDDGSAITIVPA